MTKANNVRRGVLLTLLGGTCWGFSGTCAKFLMDGYGVTPLWLLCVRQLTASLLFFVYVFAAPRERVRFAELGEAVRTSPRSSGIGLFFATAFCMMVNSLSYIMTIKITNSATATVLQALSLVLLMIFSCVVAKRLPRRRESLGLALALGGTFLLATGGDPSKLAMPLNGLLWGFAAATTYAIYSAVPAKILEKWGSPVVNAISMLISGGGLAILIHPWENVPAFDFAGIVALVAISVVGSFLAYAFYMQGVKDLGPLRANMLGTSEPISATIFSVLWLGTTFSPTDLIGFAMIITMVYLTA